MNHSAKSARSKKVNRRTKGQKSNLVVKVDPYQSDYWKHVPITQSHANRGITVPENLGVLFGHSVKLTDNTWRHYYCSKYFTFQFFPMDEESDLKDPCLFCLGAQYNRPIEEICSVVDILMRLKVNDAQQKNLRRQLQEIIRSWKDEMLLTGRTTNGTLDI